MLVQKALELMSLVPKRCNDMMNLGRLQGYEVHLRQGVRVTIQQEASQIEWHALFLFQGKLTSQGKLLQQETFCVWEQDGGVLSRSKERRVFLFEQIVIFSELLRKGSNNPGYQFKNSIKVCPTSTDRSGLIRFLKGATVLFCLRQVSYLAMQDSVEGDPCKFVLWSRGSAERFTLQASSASVKMTWVETIAILLDAQNNFLSGLGTIKASSMS